MKAPQTAGRPNNPDGPSCSHTDPPWARRPDRRGSPPLSWPVYNNSSHLCSGSSEQLSSASTKRSNPACKGNVQHATMFTYKGNVKVYGPLNIPHQTCVLTRKQQNNILNTCGLWPSIVDCEEWGEEWGIWAGSTCTRQCWHALAIS